MNKDPFHQAIERLIAGCRLAPEWTPEQRAERRRERRRIQQRIARFRRKHSELGRRLDQELNGGADDAD